MHKLACHMKYIYTMLFTTCGLSILSSGSSVAIGTVQKRGTTADGSGSPIAFQSGEGGEGVGQH